MNQWQPIETPPKYGEMVLTKSADSEWPRVACRVNDSRWVMADGQGGTISEPDYWMHLPSPPEAA